MAMLGLFVPDLNAVVAMVRAFMGAAAAEHREAIRDSIVVNEKRRKKKNFCKVLWLERWLQADG